MTNFRQFLNYIIILSAVTFLGVYAPPNRVNFEEEPQIQQVRTIKIVGIDKMKFVVDQLQPGIQTGDRIKSITGEPYVLLESINVKPGQEIRIVLTTRSEIPKRAMSHNWILLKQGTDPAEFDKDAVLAPGNNYIPPDREDQIITRTALAAPGETVEVTFTAPNEIGEYDYLCSFPGHFANGMRGKLIVSR